MKAYICFVICLILPSTSFSTRNLIIQPISAIYELGENSQLTLRVSNDGERLELVKLIIDDRTLLVPKKDLVIVERPVLNAVMVSGGAIGEKNVNKPKFVTVGFGANNCDLYACPFRVTFSFKGGEYKEYFIVKNKDGA